MIDGRSQNVLLHGGHVIDPANGIDGPADLLISDGKITAVGVNLDPPSGTKRVDLPGKFITPGLIDIHVHAFETHSRSKLSLNPIVHTFRSGVTTIVDAGTAGWRDFPIFKEEIKLPT